jgi:hypothetical protein
MLDSLTGSSWTATLSIARSSSMTPGPSTVSYSDVNEEQLPPDVPSARGSDERNGQTSRGRIENSPMENGQTCQTRKILDFISLRNEDNDTNVRRSVVTL